MQGNPTIRRIACGLAVALLPALAGCGWWAWKGDAASTEEDGTAETTPEETTDETSADGEGDTSTGDGGDGSDTTTSPDGTEDPLDNTSENAACTTDEDCFEGETCQDGLCVITPAPNDDLAGLASDPDTGAEVDLAAPLTVGDTVSLAAPDAAAAATRQSADECTCAWSVDPDSAGTFTAPADCATDFTALQAVDLTISVDVTCSGTTSTYRQDLTVEAAGTTTCTTDADCGTGETCQDGACTAAPTTPATCTTDADCPTGELCVAGACTADTGSSCTTDEDCADGELCEAGDCVTAPVANPTLTLLGKDTQAPYIVRLNLMLEDAEGLALAEGVTAEHFRISEDGERIDQTETSVFVTAAPNLPLRLVLVLDYTNSLRSVDAISDMISAAEAFIRAEHFTATHSVGVVEFHDRTDAGEGFSTAVPLTTADLLGKETIVAGLPAEDALESGLSRAWDAVDLALDMLAADEPQPGEARAIVFLTDGQDTTSEQTPETLTTKAKDGLVALYPIGFGNVGQSLQTLQSLAADTGGAYFPAAGASALESTFAEIARQLQGHWSLSYVSPSNSGTVALEASFDWDGGTATLAETFDAAALAGDIHQGLLAVTDRAYDSAQNRTSFVIKAEYVPRSISRFRFRFAHSTAAFNLQDTGGLTALSDGWRATPLGGGVYDVIGPASLDYGAFGNIGVASVPGDVPLLQVSHDDSVYAGLAQPKTILFEEHLWSAPYTLTVIVQPESTGWVVIDPLQAGYAHGETVTLTAVGGTELFDSWSGDHTGTVSPATITMDGNKTITANFGD